MDRYEALRHAVKAHGSTVDKCGSLYVLHPMAVARAIEDNYDSGWKADAAVVALLHDVWEDTDYDLPTKQMTVPQYAVLQAMTRLPDETYAQYIEKIINCEYPFAIIVKLADIWHNLRPIRQKCLPEGEQRGLEKRYLKSCDLLWAAQDEAWWPA